MRFERSGPPFLAKRCRFDEKTGEADSFLTDLLILDLNLILDFNAFRRQNSRRAARVRYILVRESQNSGACRAAVDFQSDAGWSCCFLVISS